jgi:hypothetical protein
MRRVSPSRCGSRLPFRLLRGERETAARTAERLVAIADEYGFAHWKDVTLVAGAAPNPRLDAAALAELHQRVMVVRSAAWRRVLCLCVLAQLSVEAGCREEGRRALAATREEDRLALLAPEMLRIEGELHLLGGTPALRDAEQCFRGAIDLARRRAEKSLELRASTSLARLLAAEGERQEARRLLADVYGWFTEGFDTRDLRAAKVLLEELDA